MEELDIKRLLDKNVLKVVLSNKQDKTFEYRKIEITRTVISGKEKYQISRYTEKQVFQENVDKNKLPIIIEEIFPKSLCQMNVYTDCAEFSFKGTKKGKILSNSKKLASPVKVSAAHNREKNYIIKEGEVIPPLVDMGVFTKDGKIVRTMYDKFRQINRFVEIVDDVISQYDGDEIYIIDFGCGKSYLTFILYYYLVNIKKIKAHITGLDLKADVIEKCNEAARRYGYDGLKFELGDINGYKTDEAVDMVVTLHACDTATDYALYNAVNWNARFILSVPCCQHEVNKCIQSKHLQPVMNYGILKERMAAIVTDSIRGNMLTYKGYKTQIMEFVDMAHSPKNLLIRAVKSNIPKSKKEQSLNEIIDMCNQLNVWPTIMKLFVDKERN